MRKTFLPLLILTVLWWGSALLLNKLFFPTPDKVLIEMLRQLQLGMLGPHLAVSLLRVLAALTAAFIPAMILGIWAGRSQRADRVLSPAIYVLFPIPKVALLPIILLFFGLGNGSKILFVALIVFFQFYLNIRDETAGINRRYFDSLSSLGGRRIDELKHIIIPALQPRIFSSLRMTLGTAIAVLFLAETFATRMGIGWYIMDAWSRISYVEMYAGITALSLSGLILFSCLDLLEKKLCPWK